VDINDLRIKVNFRRPGTTLGASAPQDRYRYRARKQAVGRWVRRAAVARGTVPVFQCCLAWL